MSLLEVNSLTTCFDTRNGTVTAVDQLSFTLEAGKTLAIVGESGSGKSVACYSLLGLVPSPPGRIARGSAMFEGQDLLQCAEAELRNIRGQRIAMIFQDPMTALNPYLRVGEQLIEPLIYHQGYSRQAAKDKALALLDEVGIRDAAKAYQAWPHEFSGGMRQRIVIAMALISEPSVLIADEPTTALDATIQKQILTLVYRIQQQRQLGLLFISHDLDVVKRLADDVLVMQHGKVVERGTTDAIFQQPQQPYTQGLLAAVPKTAKLQPRQHTSKTLLNIENLEVAYGRGRHQHTVVNDVSLTIQRGETVGLVGESGSGKSTIGKAIMGLVASQRGRIEFDGHRINGLTTKQMRPYRQRLQMIFQDPYASLNPRMSVYDCLAEPLRLHAGVSKTALNRTVLALADEVGLAASAIKKYPHEFSGGQRQRIAIGRAIACEPELLVADEPVSALDVTIQQQILALLLGLAKERELSMLFISHDLQVVRYMCDRVVVLQQGKVVEQAATETLWHHPTTDYTRDLLNARY